MRVLSGDFSESVREIGGLQINYAEGPANGPPLLLIHGISGRLQDWHSVSEAFSQRWHVYAVDLRGHGKSSWAPDGYHWRLYSSDQVGFIEKVIGEPAYVVGHSLGGATALGLNYLRSDLVRAAVYEDPPLFLHRRWEGNQFRNSFMETLDVLDTKPDLQTVFDYVKSADPILPDHYCWERAEKLLAMDPEVYRSTSSGRARTNWRIEDLLKGAASPGLLLQAEPMLGSALNDEEAAEAMELLPNAEFEKWEDSTHGMHSSFPERYLERVTRFFAAH